jgi:hypothetical protein
MLLESFALNGSSQLLQLHSDRTESFRPFSFLFYFRKIFRTIFPSKFKASFFAADLDYIDIM